MLRDPTSVPVISRVVPSALAVDPTSVVGGERKETLKRFHPSATRLYSTTSGSDTLFAHMPTLDGWQPCGSRDFRIEDMYPALGDLLIRLTRTYPPDDNGFCNNLHTADVAIPFSYQNDFFSDVELGEPEMEDCLMTAYRSALEFAFLVRRNLTFTGIELQPGLAGDGCDFSKHPLHTKDGEVVTTHFALRFYVRLFDKERWDTRADFFYICKSAWLLLGGKVTNYHPEKVQKTEAGRRAAALQRVLADKRISRTVAAGASEEPEDPCEVVGFARDVSLFL